MMSRHIGAAVLLLLYLGTATELPQLAKLPMLVAHLIEHAQQEHLSFGEFIAEHYFKGDVYDADRGRDLQLPFKVELPGAWSIVATVPVPKLWAMMPIYCSSVSPCLGPAPSLLWGIATSVWHPPTCHLASLL
jgi:hypothetical protein